MIKFFRKIRQNLLSEGKTGMYLKYAIGEIILVVIGILIALQINNWNSYRNDLKKVEKYLTEVQNNIKADVARIDTLLPYNTTKVKGLKRAILYYYNADDEPSYIDSIRALTLSGQISKLGEFYPSKSGINALLGSGDINMIPDSIRIKLNKYYELINENSPLIERITILTRSITQDRLLKQVVNKAYIEEFIQFEIPSKNVQAEKIFIQDNDIPVDMMFLAFLVNSCNSELKEIRQMGVEMILTLEKLMKK